MLKYDQEKTNIAEKAYIGPIENSQCNAYRPMTESEILVQLFAYHPPTPEQLPKYAAINQAVFEEAAREAPMELMGMTVLFPDDMKESEVRVA